MRKCLKSQCVYLLISHPAFACQAVPRSPQPSPRVLNWGCWHLKHGKNERVKKQDSVWLNDSMMCGCHAYCPSIHDQSHLGGLVDMSSEGDAGARTPLAAVVRSTLKR